MGSAMSRVVCTMELMYYAVWPSRGGRAVVAQARPTGEDGFRTLAPRQIRGGVERFLDGRGELRLFFEGCLSVAAPCVLFRLKREGFSCCKVRTSHRGLYVVGRR